MDVTLSLEWGDFNDDFFYDSLTNHNNPTTSINPGLSSNLSAEDQEAILRVLSEDDDDGLAAKFGKDVFTGSSSAISKNSTAPSSKLIDRKLSLVDPEWENIDPNPDIFSLFQQFNKEFFWSKLNSVEVKWSKQMMMCAGICRYESGGGYCSVGLSLPLLKFRPRKDLVETLLHEMIHAYLFVAENNREHESHGPNFHSHMYRLNKLTGTNITVYHSFHDEVDYYRQHIWRCNGPCRDHRPYMGFIKRSRNRAPGPSDSWFSQHQQSCGGTFVKIKEPEGFCQRKRKKLALEGATPKKSLSFNQLTLDIFPGFEAAKQSKPINVPVNGNFGPADLRAKRLRLFDTNHTQSTSSGTANKQDRSTLLNSKAKSAVVPELSKFLGRKAAMPEIITLDD